MAQIETKKLSDFKSQNENANGHTERGLKSLSVAYEKVGYVAPMTADANNEILDGSARLQKAVDQFPDEALVIRHDGSKPVIMVREDIKDGTDPKAKLISYGANRIAETNLDWEPGQVLVDVENGVDLSGLFSDNELAEMEDEVRLSAELADTLLTGGVVSDNRMLGDKQKQIKPVLYIDEVNIFEDAIKAVGMRNRGQALVQICKEYLEKKEGQFNF